MRNKKGTKADPTKCRAIITTKESIADTVPEPRGIRGGGGGGRNYMYLYMTYYGCACRIAPFFSATAARYTIGLLSPLFSKMKKKYMNDPVSEWSRFLTIAISAKKPKL